MYFGSSLLLGRCDRERATYDFMRDDAGGGACTRGGESGGLAAVSSASSL